MSLTEREQLYVDMMLSPKTKGEDFTRVFSQQELIEYKESDKIQDAILDEQLKELDIKRARQAKAMLDLENLEKMIPLAYEAMIDILKNPHSKNAPQIIRMILSGKVSYLEKFGEAIAAKDTGLDQTNGSGETKITLAYNLDDLPDD